MKKILMIGVALCLIPQIALSATNAFCPNPQDCPKVADIMYKGMIAGYVHTMVDYQKEQGQPIDAAAASKEIQEMLSYSDFYSVFTECGQKYTNMETEIESLKMCLLESIKPKIFKYMESKLGHSK